MTKGFALMFDRWVFFGLLLTAGVVGCSKSSSPHRAPGDDDSNVGAAGREVAPPSRTAGVPGSGGSSAGSSATVAGAGGIAAVELPRTCDALAAAACEQLGSCSPFKLKTAFGTAAECTRVVAGVCAHFEDAGTSLDWAGCANALNAPYCAAINAKGAIPLVCLSPRGGRASGEECGRNADCASLSCQKKVGCGTCLARGAVDEACLAADECEDGLVCNLGHCAQPVAPGAHCDLKADLRCPPGTLCVDNKCKPDGIEGETCGDVFARCSHGLGFACRNGGCTALSAAAKGEACGTSSNAECAVGACSGTWSDQQCVKASDLGGLCNPGACRSPYTCVDGKCAIEEASSCK